jgi:hypothetical protein
MKNRNALDTVIEKEAHALVSKIKEHVYDFVHLHIRRNNIPIEHSVIEELLKHVGTAIQDGEMKHIDAFHIGIKKVLDEYLLADEVNTEIPFSLLPPEKKQDNETKSSQNTSFHL